MSMSVASKIAAVLLIVAFLATTIGSAFGFAICDHGVLSKTHLSNHEQGEHFDLFGPAAHTNQAASLQAKKDNCQDLSFHSKEGILETADTSEVPYSTLHDSTHSSTFCFPQCRLSFYRLHDRENPKIPQYLLSLRTTVLLI